MALTAQKKKQTTIHEKRRHGQHHKQSKRYHNAYWPYLPLACIVALGIALNSFWPTIQNSVLGFATNTSTSGLLVETNKERAANSVGALALNAQLSAAAQAKANDMAARNYWSHNTPEGNPPWVFIKQAGYPYHAAGENLAYGFDSSGTTVAGWMASPPHKANLLNNTYKDVGFGIANVEDYQGTGQQTIVVAMYGNRVPAPAPDPAPAQTAPAPPIDSTPAPQTAEVPKEPQPEEAPAQAAEPVAAAQQETNAGATTEQKQPGTEQVARLQLLTNANAAWSMFAVITIASVAAAIFLFRHSLLWHRTLVKGERFVAKHHLLDVVLVVVAVAAVLLTRAAGTIQ